MAKRRVKVKTKIKDERTIRFFKIFLGIVIFYGLLGIFDNLMNIKGISLPLIYLLFTFLFSLFIFVFSFVALIKFVKSRITKLSWVLPIYYIFMFIVLFILGFTSPQPSTILGLSYFGLISSFLEIIFALYLLRIARNL